MLPGNEGNLSENSPLPFGHLHLPNIIKDLPELLQQIESIQRRELLLVVDGIGTTKKLLGIRQATSQNIARVNEGIFGYITVVMWLVKFLNNLFGAEVLMINGSYGDRIDVVTIQNNAPPFVSATALILLALMLKTQSDVKSSVRAILALKGDTMDWQSSTVQRGDLETTGINFRDDFIALTRDSRKNEGIREDEGILFSDNLLDLQQFLTDSFYLDELAVPTPGLWSKQNIETSSEVPQVRSETPEIVTTCTLVITGDSSHVVARALLQYITGNLGLVAQGGPDGEKGNWEWYSIRLGSTQVEELRKKLFEISMQIQIQMSFPDSLIGLTVGTGLWQKMDGRSLVIHPYAASVFSRIMAQLRDQKRSGVYSIGNIAPFPYNTTPSSIPAWEGELVEEVHPEMNNRYIDIDPAANMSTFVLRNPLMCLPGMKLEEVIKLFSDGLHADGTINNSTYVLAERIMSHDTHILPDSYSTVTQEWLERLNKHSRWIMACIGIVGDMMSEDFAKILSDRLYDITGETVDMSNFSSLVSNPQELGEPSSMTYNFASIIKKSALDLLGDVGFQGFFMEVFYHVLSDYTAEEIACSEYAPQIIPLVSFYFEAIKSHPELIKLINPYDVYRASLGACLYLQKSGLDFRDVLKMCDFESATVGTIDWEIYLLLQLHLSHENPGHLSPELHDEYLSQLNSFREISNLSSALGMRLRAMVMGKERSFAGKYLHKNLDRLGDRGWEDVDVDSLFRDFASFVSASDGKNFDEGRLMAELPNLSERVNRLMRIYLAYIHTDTGFEVLSTLAQIREKILILSRDKVFATDLQAEMFLGGIDSDAFYILHMVSSLRTFPVSDVEIDPADEPMYLAEVCDKYIDAAKSILQKIDSLKSDLRFCKNIYAYDEDNVINTTLSEAKAILEIRRANLILIRNKCVQITSTGLVDAAILGLNATLDGDHINYVISSRALINLIALFGTFKKNDITLDDMRVWTGTALQNTIRTGGDAFASIINIYTAVAEERISDELRVKMTRLFSYDDAENGAERRDGSVVFAYNQLVATLPTWLEQQINIGEIPITMLKDYVEAILGIIFRFGMDKHFSNNVEILLEYLYNSSALATLLFTEETRLRLHTEGIKAAKKYRPFKKEPTLIEEIGSLSLVEN